MRDKNPKGWPFQTQKLLIPWGPRSSLLEAAHSQHPAPQAGHRSPAVNSLCLPRQKAKPGGASRLGGEAGTGPEALTPGIGCLWQAKSWPNIKTSYLGASREAGWGYSFSSHYRQVAGMSSSHPPPLQRDLVWQKEGGCRMLQEEAFPWFLSQKERDIADPTE